MSTTIDPLDEHHLGDVPLHTPDGRDTTLHVGRASAVGDIAMPPGEFDVPPEEPVVLLGEVPWELREG